MSFFCFKALKAQDRITKIAGLIAGHQVDVSRAWESQIQRLMKCFYVMLLYESTFPDSITPVSLRYCCNCLTGLKALQCSAESLINEIQANANQAETKKGVA